MEVQRNVKIQHSGESEGSWSSGSISTSQLPKFSRKELERPSVQGFKQSLARLFFSSLEAEEEGTVGSEGQVVKRSHREPSA